MPVYTLIAYGQSATFRASNEDRLTRRLYLRSTWTMGECRTIAQRLRRGIVTVALDYETIVLPGRWDHVQDRPESRPIDEWNDGDRALTRLDTPLLSGGVK